MIIIIHFYSNQKQQIQIKTDHFVYFPKFRIIKISKNPKLADKQMTQKQTVQTKNLANPITQVLAMQPIQLPQTTLSTKNLFTHYFLIHDFLFRTVKSPPNNGKYFDMQIQVDQAMRGATKLGGKIGQVGTFSALLVYCLKGKSVKLKLFSGFLYMYWIDHFYTLGSYLGILLRMPSVYKRTGDYFLQNQPMDDKNLFLRLNEQMKTNADYEDTQQILNKVFGQEIVEGKTYLTNQFFSKNKQKYFNKNEGTLIQRSNMKLKYMDCFLTRYVYYTFERWYTKKLSSFGIMKGDF